MALDFPNAPITGATFPGPNGALWQWDGEKWTAVSTSSTGGGGGASIVMQPSPPALAANALWWDTIGGQLYVCYDDGVGPLQWVTAANIPGPPASQVTQVDVASAQRNVGRNLIHNALFTVAQRGAGPWTTPSGTYTLDRWVLGLINDANSFTAAPLADGDRAGIGDEAAQTALQNVFTGSATGGSCSFVIQRIENVRRLSGKTVTVSFYAKATSGTPKLGVGIAQSGGSGGSPFIVYTTGTATASLSSTWQRYSQAISLPSTAGLTFGSTAGTDSTNLEIYFSSTTNGTRACPPIGQQSGTVQLWGVQLEIAAPGQTAPTPLEKMDAQQTLAVCQRFYSTGYVQFTSYQAAGAGYAVTAAFPVTMRAAPATVTFSATSLINLPSISLISSNTYAAYIQGIATATATTSIATTFTASADL